ncbi:uncharacterized protein LOC116977141 isoform X2 [Amblyraja radiata]|uniref:uncharacterized protein LOC116977141 isoform X2 n=1 Tax=Amblyraja radiata TaxID=386614 RepID=UPI0014021709|nr:uncharacterized protein LOC116977141 isoform X2 [Amblyraja radiata]
MTMASGRAAERQRSVPGERRGGGVGRAQRQTQPQTQTQARSPSGHIGMKMGMSLGLPAADKQPPQQQQQQQQQRQESEQDSNVGVSSQMSRLQVSDSHDDKSQREAGSRPQSAKPETAETGESGGEGLENRLDQPVVQGDGQPLQPAADGKVCEGQRRRWARTGCALGQQRLCDHSVWPTAAHREAAARPPGGPWSSCTRHRRCCHLDIHGADGVDGVQGEGAAGESGRDDGAAWQRGDSPGAHPSSGHLHHLGLCHRHLRSWLWDLLRVGAGDGHGDHRAGQRVQRGRGG